MAVSLGKGSNVSLSQTDPSLKHILIGLGWEARSSDGEDFDLDASAFMVGDNGKVSREEDFIFYNKLVSTCGSVVHTGDDPMGGSGGDDEALKIDFEKVPDSIKRVIVCVTIHDAEARKQNFGQVENAFMRIVNLDTDVEIARFDLSEDYSTETAMIFGEVYRHNDEWKFKAVGQGFTGGLESLCKKFGVQTA
jgi:tellurium resistance protein TerD